ncbi:hypothetical protein RND81_12G007400 [Saponaria officinalis]|uniref:Uncharacterized protein n=1 Tax=Saponaria officinalis TaxID=3572 RepID=A0AAW1H688_SAPOF
MVNCATPKDEGLKDLLKPFYQRAADAEVRLSKLEAELSLKSGNSLPVNEENAKVKELESKLEEMTRELAAEREKVAKLTAENNKKDYRITHLVRTIKEADLKLEKLTLS